MRYLPSVMLIIMSMVYAIKYHFSGMGGHAIALHIFIAASLISAQVIAIFNNDEEGNKMLNIETLNYKAKEKKAKTKSGTTVQPSAQSTKDSFIDVLRDGDWVACKEVKAITGFTADTVSRAAAHLINDKVIITKAIQNGMARNVYYKLA